MPEVPEESENKTETGVENTETLSNSESIGLSLEQKYKIVGKKDSILDRRGIHLSIGYLDELLAQGIVITDGEDLEGIADAVATKFAEVTGKNLEEAMSSEKIKEKKLVVEDYIKKYGFDTPHSMGLLEDWVRESMKWVNAEGTPRANIIHNLRVMDLLRTGGKMDEARAAARDAYNMATSEQQWDIVDDILYEFPEFGTKTDL